MEKITYGAPRLVDWVAQIKVGAASVRVHFTGGALTSYGVTPAEYTTANPFIQKVIEQSSYFKEGRIILLRRAPIATSVKPAKPAKFKQQPNSKPTPVRQVVQSVENAPAPAEQLTESIEVETPRQPSEELAEVVETDADTGGLTIVEASCLQDAQAYLQENFNISSYKVRSYEAAQRAAAEHGVRFVGAKFGNAESSEATENETAEEEE